MLKNIFLVNRWRYKIEYMWKLLLYINSIRCMPRNSYLFLSFKWFKSHMSDRVQAVHINGSTSPARPLTCGVPQGSVLGPQLFSIYAAPVSKIIRNNNMLSHFDADDTQIYITVNPHQEDIDAAVETIEQCVTEIRSWMKTNSLKLNDSKTEVIVYGSAQQLKKFTLQSLRVGDCVVRVTDSVRNFGVQFDADMKMESHVTAVCKSAIFHLRNISRIRRYLTAAATEQVRVFSELRPREMN